MGVSLIARIGAYCLGGILGIISPADQPRKQFLRARQNSSHAIAANRPSHVLARCIFLASTAFLKATLRSQEELRILVAQT
jgi:hypothetical protein